MRLTFCLLVIFTLSVFRTHADETKPNVLFLSVDDLNDWIGCLGGHPQALTPNMDRLAGRGVLFTNAHCAATACNPSRAAMFSGKLPQHSGVWSNDRGQAIRKSLPDAELIPGSFANAGYKTLGTGKLLHKSGGQEFQHYFKTDQRWSPFANKKMVEYTAEELPSKGTPNPRHVAKDSLGREVILPLNRMPSDRTPTKKSGESFDWGPFDVPDSDFGDTKITDWAIEQINAASDKPLFLGVGYYRPHQPLYAPKRFFDRFENAHAILPPTDDDDLNDLSDVAKTWALEAVTSGLHSTVVKHDQWRPAVEAYLACVTYVDHEIGRLLDALEKSSLAENTLIVLWSDHGWHLGEKQHWGKWTGWERATRVPLIIVPPKRVRAEYSGGSKCDRPVGLIDVYPTLLDICGIQGPERLDGVSLLPLVKNPKMESDRSVVTTFDPNNVSLRTQQFRYIRYADGNEELYNHRSDANEWNNLVADPKYQSQLRAMRKRAAEYLSEKPQN